MNFPDGLFGAPWLWAGTVVYVAALLAAAWSRPWRALRDSTRHHLFLGSCVAWMVLWMLKAGVAPGLNVHLLGATWFTLVFGWRLALFGMTLVLAAVTAVGMSGVTTFALNAIVAGVVPVACSHAVQRAIARRLPAHLFVYLFGSGFFNAALATAASAVAAVALLYGSGAYDWQRLADDYLPYALLAAFPEAFVTGAGISYFVVYHPGWVVSFREEWYLER